MVPLVVVLALLVEEQEQELDRADPLFLEALAVEEQQFQLSSFDHASFWVAETVALLRWQRQRQQLPL